MKSLASPEDLRKVLTYDAAKGRLWWRPRSPEMFNCDAAMSASARCALWNKRFAGKEAFTADKGDGRKISPVFGRIYLAHRAAWAIHYGTWPTGQIDHINGDPSDNTIENLRDVSQQTNCRNLPRRRDNTSGAVGVSQHPNGWCVRLGRAYVGLFSSFADAVSARKAAEISAGYHSNHGRQQA